MIKCIECLRLEYHEQLKFNGVQEAIVIFSGKSYCYKHFCQEIGWNEL